MNCTSAGDAETTGTYWPSTCTLVPPKSVELPDGSERDELVSESPLPLKEAMAPGLHVRSTAVRLGVPDVISIVTCLEVDWATALVAVNVTCCFPRWLAAGVHSKAPVLVSKVAPAGKSEATIWTGRSAGSAADTVKRTAEPCFAVWLVGALTIGWEAAATWT